MLKRNDERFEIEIDLEMLDLGKSVWDDENRWERREINDELKVVAVWLTASPNNQIPERGLNYRNLPLFHSLSRKPLLPTFLPNPKDSHPSILIPKLACRLNDKSSQKIFIHL